MEDILYPSYDIIEIQLHFIDVRVKSMLLHILLDMSTAHPIKSCLQEILANNRTRDIPSPFLSTCICLITELLASSTDKRPRIDSVQLFLLIQFYTTNIDDFKPFPDFRLCAFADISQELSFLYQFFLIIRKSLELKRYPTYHH